MNTQAFRRAWAEASAGGARAGLARVTALAALAAVIAVGGLAGCSALKPTPVTPPVVYTLDGLRTQASTQQPARPTATQAPAARSAPSTPSTPSAPTAPTAPTLLLSTPQAAASLDSPHMLYVRQAHRLAYFAHSEWADTPARMLAPLLVAALDRAGLFRAVVSTPTAVKADLRLDTEVVRLQHHFDTSPSHVRLTLRATLSDNTTRQLLAQVELDQRADAPSEDAQGGVVAANLATQQMLSALVAFCGPAVESWRLSPGAAAQPALPVRTPR